MSDDYTDNNTNDLTNALRTYGETKGSERYRRSLTQTVTRTNAKGEKVSKEVEVKDAERLHVVTRIIDDAIDVVVAKIDEKVEESDLNNEDTVEPFADMLARYAHRLRGFTCYADGSRGGQPLTAVPYHEASNRQGEELVETHDICDITGHGGSCGV